MMEDLHYQYMVFQTNAMNNTLQDLGQFSQLDLLCSTLDNDEYEVAEISFNFWYSLSELLYRQDDQQLNQAFSPYIQRVILSLCKHVQLDTDLVSACTISSIYSPPCTTTFCSNVHINFDT